MDGILQKSQSSLTTVIIREREGAISSFPISSTVLYYSSNFESEVIRI